MGRHHTRTLVLATCTWALTSSPGTISGYKFPVLSENPSRRSRLVRRPPRCRDTPGGWVSAATGEVWTAGRRSRWRRPRHRPGTATSQARLSGGGPRTPGRLVGVVDASRCVSRRRVADAGPHSQRQARPWAEPAPEGRQAEPSARYAWAGRYHGDFCAAAGRHGFSRTTAP